MDYHRIYLFVLIHTLAIDNVFVDTYSQDNKYP